MAAMYQPMLRFYRLSPLWGLALPLIGCFLFRQGRKLARRLAAGRPGPAHAGPGLDGG